MCIGRGVCVYMYVVCDMSVYMCIQRGVYMCVGGRGISCVHV